MAIYFLQAGDGFPIKIGFSDNPARRIAQIQISHWQRLTLLGTLDGTEADECALHERFAAALVNGEWYEPVPELLAHIEKFATPPTPRRSLSSIEYDPRHLVDGSLRELFRAKGVRQRDVAKTLGISEPSMSCWASRQRPIPSRAVMPLAEALGVSIDDILAVATPLPPGWTA